MKLSASISDLICNNCIWSKELETADRLNDFGRPFRSGINCQYQDKQVHKDSFCKDGQWIILCDNKYTVHDRAACITFILNENPEKNLKK